MDVSIFGPSFTAFRTKYAFMGGYCRDLHDRFWKARRGAAFRIAA